MLFLLWTVMLAASTKKVTNRKNGKTCNQLQGRENSSKAFKGWKIPSQLQARAKPIASGKRGKTYNQ